MTPAPASRRSKAAAGPLDTGLAIAHAIFYQSQFQDWVMTDQINHVIDRYCLLAIIVFGEGLVDVSIQRGDTLVTCPSCQRILYFWEDAIGEGEVEVETD